MLYDTRKHIIQAVNKMTEIQQLPLLDLIYALQDHSQQTSPQGILQFSGVFDVEDTQDFLLSLRDTEQIEAI